MIIEDKKFVAVSYDLFIKDEEGKLELWEQAPASEPLKFTCGLGMMLDKFEQNLRGLKEGDTFDFTISKDDAYGEYEDGRVIELDKSIFVVDGKFDDEYIKEGNIVPMMDAEGNRMNGIVLKISKDKVKMDFNHPLAGEDLNFRGKVIEVRDATEEEIAVATKPHKCGHCGGNCGNCDSECGGDCDGGCDGDEGCGKGHCNK
ncbi:MAG: FKBP-type peptidyl-prolyl cis-trans isomerase [Paludibacteraceae bacterium]|nr:FKBP-type peptidyl-prolyl cis-trans isomerase [Paludibacteraceae bacterium]